ncbi:flavin reductase [Rhodococcus hoagii]|nr:flavin reductase [Prescottella equi]
MTAFTAISLEPRLCQVTLTRTSKACSFLSGAPFAVNILAADQTDVALHFAGRPQSPEPVWVKAPPHRYWPAAQPPCRVCPGAKYDGGDHVIFIGEIVDAQARDTDPLLFYRSTFHDLGAPSANAAWNGSMDDPHRAGSTPPPRSHPCTCPVRPTDPPFTQERR